jgi:hypothetical protein
MRLAFVGGIHGGYEWNTILLAYQAIDHFIAHPYQVPPNISLYVVPVANPDGQAQVLPAPGRFTPAEVEVVTAPGRFNGNGVDLNRNWDCDWQPTGYWGNARVSAGSAPFSEIETQILRDFFTEPRMHAVVFWHSAVPGVFFGDCGTGFAPSAALAAVYAEAAEYPLYESFDFYRVTGAASDWLTLQGIPAIAVELNDHSDLDWAQNLTGVRAVMVAFDGAVPR